MEAFVRRHPVWSAIILIAAAAVAWLILAPWPPALEEALGRKRIFLNAVFSGVTLGALYFLVASGFTLIFGLMRNVNLAHGSLYLLGGYIGYEVSDATGSWLFAFPVVFVIVAALGMVLQYVSSGGWRARSCARPSSPSACRWWWPTSCCGSGAGRPTRS
jgi:branched-chain amino acid transport system permease protein